MGESTSDNPFKSIDEVVTYIKESRQSVSYHQMVSPDTRVFALGETHNMIGSRIEAVIALDEFYKLGFTHLGIEMLDTSMQKILDKYCVDGTGREEIYSHLDRNFRWIVSSADEYMQIIDKAKSLGMKIIALDLPSEQRNVLPREEILRKRDEEMAKRTMDVLNESDSNKVVTFSGKVHAGYTGTVMTQLLRKSGIEVVSAHIIGDSDTTGYLEEAALQAGVSNERFMFTARARFPKSKTAPSADFVIHLPQINKNQSNLILLNQI